MSTTSGMIEIPHELGKRVKISSEDPKLLFDIGACIGEGTYGEVREAIVKASGEFH